MGKQKLENHVYASSISNDTSLPGGAKHPHPARKKKDSPDPTKSLPRGLEKDACHHLIHQHHVTHRNIFCIQNCTKIFSLYGADVPGCKISCFVASQLC